MKRILSAVAAVLLAVTGLAVTPIAGATDYPTKPIRILVSFTPGGPTDLFARGLARHFSEVWKQTVVVENKPGAGGLLALQGTLAAPADGYTLVLHSDGFAIAPAIYPKLTYDALRDFAPIAIVARAPNILAVAPDGPYNTIAKLVQAGKVAGGVSYASAGVGSAQHLQGAKFALQAGMVEPLHVPFKGTPEAMNEVMAGRVDFVFAPISTVMPLLTTGKLKALAVSTKERTPLLKDLPTVAEQGYPKFAEEQWWGLFAPSGVPPAIVAKVEAETRVALKTAPMVDLIKQLSSTPADLYGKDFANQIASEIRFNTAAARAGNISSN